MTKKELSKMLSPYYTEVKNLIIYKENGYNEEAIKKLENIDMFYQIIKRNFKL